MLHELHIESMGVIETLDLVLSPGLTAFTGETGAGKTMLVEAINLLVGGRADPSIVRTGRARGSGRRPFRRWRRRVHRVTGDPDGRQVTRLCQRAPGNRGDARRAGAREPSTCTASTPIRACCRRPRSATRSIASARRISNRCERLGRG